MRALSLAGVRFAYRGEDVLHGVDVAVNDGEMVCIVGPNGSGKSTLLKCASGHLSPRTGDVRLFEKPLAGYTRREVARYVAFVAQETPVMFGYTAADFVLLGRRPYHGVLPFDSQEDRAAGERAMRETETAAFAGRALTELSGGERQRVVIASALAQDPSVLLLDEPTASLDLHYQIQIHELLARLNRERRITVVVVTHDLNLAALFFPRVVVLDQGRVAADGAPVDVLDADLVRRVWRVEVTWQRHPDGTPLIVPFPSGRA